MKSHAVRLLLFSVMFGCAPSSHAQVAPSNPETPGLTTVQSGSRFPAMRLKTHSIWTQSALRPAWQLDTAGELIVSNGLIQFHDSTDTKASFSFPISDLRSVERRNGPEGLRVLRLSLINKKNFDLVPDVFANRPATEDKGVGITEKAMDESVSAMEKVIRDMASQHGVVLK